MSSTFSCSLLSLVFVIGSLARPGVAAEEDTRDNPQSIPTAVPTVDWHPNGFVSHPGGGYWQPGANEARIGSPYYYSVGGTKGLWNRPGKTCCSVHWDGNPIATDGDSWGIDPYSYHFGPGYYRHWERGNQRFPYYSYRSPWYFPGHPVYTRDTNFAW